MDCNKTPYRSAHHAREAVRKMGNSIRVYYCKQCHAHHVTKMRDASEMIDSKSWRVKKKRKARAKLRDDD